MLPMISTVKAKKLQECLASRLSIKDDYSSLFYVAGADTSYLLREKLAIGVAVLLEYPSLKLKDVKVCTTKCAIPYIPGLLAFREAPAIISALRMLEKKPDIVLVDGHGISHPRGLGIASHVGMALDIPSIGIAKRRLCGQETVLSGKEVVVYNGNVVAIVVKRGKKKLYISPGNKVSVSSAYNITLRMFKGNSYLPEPIRLADKISKEIARLWKG